MIVSIVVAAAENNAIGMAGKLPWHLPDDLKFFKSITQGKPVVMGRKTFESLGQLLPGRTNIILSSDRGYTGPAGSVVKHSLQGALDWIECTGAPEACIIGGAKVLEAALPVADCIYLTRVHTSIKDADTWLPALDHTQWKSVWEQFHPPDANHRFAFTFHKFERIAL